MKKFGVGFAKVLLTLILIMPIVGSFGVFPAPTRDLYNSDIAFGFINALMQAKYVMWINAVVCGLVIVGIWARREALAALLLLPFSVHVVAFHLFLDGGIFTVGAIMADLLLILNLVFLYLNREKYAFLLKKS